MGEFLLADLSRRVRALGTPITKGASEPMHDRWNAWLTEQLRECVVGQRPPRDARKSQAGANGPLMGFGQDLRCPLAERIAVLALHLRSVCRNCPRSRLEVDFTPSRAFLTSPQHDAVRIR